MPTKKLKINKIDLDSLEKTPIVSIEKSVDQSLELVSEKIIEHVSVTNLSGKVIHESDINRTRFVFTYKASCKDMLLLKIRMHKQKGESQILIV